MTKYNILSGECYFCKDWSRWPCKCGQCHFKFFVVACRSCGRKFRDNPSEERTRILQDVKDVCYRNPGLSEYRVYKPGEEGFEREREMMRRGDVGPPWEVGDAAVQVRGASDVVRRGGGPQSTCGGESVHGGRSTNREGGDAHEERRTSGGSCHGGHHHYHHHRRHRHTRYGHHYSHGEASTRGQQSRVDFNTIIPPEADNTALRAETHQTPGPRAHGEASTRVPQSGFDFDAIFPTETGAAASRTRPQHSQVHRSNGEASTRVPQSGFDFDAIFPAEADATISRTGSGPSDGHRR